MSVTCHNFVQNAWKKDLCSNCFKSVGDHERIDASEQEDSSCPEHRNSTYSPQTISPNGSTNPHTTWKSLISEKNGKNSQPFKLENGFKGRLLTINKALNGTDKQNYGEVIKNKTVVQTPTKEGFVKATTNGYMKREQAEKPNNTSDANQNGKISTEQNTGKCKLKDAQPENKSNSSNGYTSIKKKSDRNGKFSKSNSEGVGTEPTRLHSILKKSTSVPAENGSQPRRSSNVGFREEEPLIIGYGGRDFSPEELEWEMASDGDGESTSDSLDETEDDRAFSNMTKQNTEFNSDNANLLENEKDSAKSTKRLKGSGPNEKHQTQVNENLQLNKNVKNENLNNDVRHTEVKHSKVKSYSNSAGTETDTNADDPRERTDIKTAAGSKRKEAHVQAKGADNSINVGAKNDETSHVTKTNDVKLPQTTEAVDSGVDVKNNSEFINGTSPPPSPVDTRKKEGSGKASNAGMFTDREDPNWQGNESEGNKGWQDGEEVPGQILQAINTSLTNRHKMRESPDLLLEGTSDSAENGSNTVSVSVNNGIAEASNESNSPILTSADENALNVEPRESFLHGAITKPSAIYGPASDLFVSRSNSSSSSSSSSSEDQSKISLSINVIVNGDRGAQNCSQSKDTEDCCGEASSNAAQENPPVKAAHQPTELKLKPKIPAKPAPKQELSLSNTEIEDDEAANTINRVNEEVTYYSTIPDGMKTSNSADAYAESNIYQEVGEKDINKAQERELGPKAPGRESKLAALAIELEQVRNTSTSIKRQAPAPPKVPDPPLEDPPSCTGRTSPVADLPQTFSSFRGEAIGFSSASSTTSTSSQDTEAGYASWNLHGDADDPPKHKFKSSFLLAQYSKCKMLAMGYAEDGARARKRFSIKKLLKIGKESELPVANDPNCPNPKAWKYNENFDRPRAKLEIIHPMDLENKSVTVNPGFDSMHSGSMSSFNANPEQVYRNSISTVNSDYGSYYSDTLSPNQDIKNEVNYEYIQPRITLRDDNEESSSKAGTSSSTSPTPSRSSTTSQTSTVTSGSSKNGGSSTRPPKPPPPPRAHSLLPGNKIIHNVDGTFKFPTNGDTSSSDEVTVPPKKPQAPRRQCKSAIIRSEYSNSDKQKSTSDLHLYDQSNENIPETVKAEELNGSYATNISTIHITHSNDQASQSLENINTSIPPNPSNDGVYDNLVTENEPKIQASITIQTNTSPQKEKLSKSILSRNKHPPLTKSPARPPPIYAKPQSGNFPKNTQPWKTLEDSYLALTSSNRELLIKLVNQASKKKKILNSKLNKFQFQWSDFEIDASQPSSVFAFGEKIAYHATMAQHPEHTLTLVISIQHPQSPEATEIKYPMYGKFVDCIPSDLLDSSEDNSELESIPATVLVLDRSIVATIESYSETLPDILSEENEKELAFIILQMIQSLKTLQVQGIEAIDCNFQNIILAKTKQDRYHSLIFLYDNCYDESDYSSGSCKVSLCQYTLMLLFQILKFQAADEDYARFSSKMSKKVFETAFSLLSEEKAVSLSQTKILFECYFWGVTRVIESLQTLDDCDNVFQRWLDIERSNFIKNIVNEDDSYDLNTQHEYYSQFLIRTSARNMREIASYL